MPKVSNLGLSLSASPIRRLEKYADAAKSAGKKVIHLNIGQPDIETPVGVVEAVKNYDYKTLKYLPSDGSLLFREKLVDYYKDINVNIKPNNIVVTNGGSEALMLALLSCADNGDEVIVPEPFYANYQTFCELYYLKLVSVPSTIENNFALPGMEEFEKKINSNTKAILLCNPNNPTGYVYSRQELEKLKDLCLKYNLFLIVDEVYREFLYDSEKLVADSALSLLGAEQNIIVVDSVSKRYSMCGARIGMLITKNENVIEVALKVAQARLSVSTYSEVAAMAAMDTPKEYFVKVRQEYKERRDLLVEKLQEIDGVICGKPQGSFYVLAELPVEDAEDFCIWMLENFSHNNTTVMLAPASGFYIDKILGKKQVRIAYVLDKENISKAVECIKLGLEEYKKNALV